MTALKNLAVERGSDGWCFCFRSVFVGSWSQENYYYICTRWSFQRNKWVHCHWSVCFSFLHMYIPTCRVQPSLWKYCSWYVWRILVQGGPKGPCSKLHGLGHNPKSQNKKLQQQQNKISTWREKTFQKQESPPAWTQEAYRPRCSKYSLCCPNWVPPPPQPGYPPSQGTLPGQGTPPAGSPPSQGTPPARVPPQLDLAGYPPSQGTPRQGTSPPARVPPQLPHGILGNVAKHYGIWVPPLWTDRLMDRRVSKHYLPVVLRTRAVIRKNVR